MVARAGAGPQPIPYKLLTADKLAEAIAEALKPETLQKAEELGAKIKEEKGSERGGKSFHDMLDADNLRCSLFPERVAVWQMGRTKTRLSALAAAVLADQGLISFANLTLYRPKEYDTEDGPWDPISGGASALLGTIASLTMGVADFPIEIFRAAKHKHQKSDAKDTVGQSSPSGSSTPTLSSSSNSRVDLGLGVDDTNESNQKETLETPGDSPTQSVKTSYESTNRSSKEMPSPETPLSSISSMGRARGRSLREALRAAKPRSRSSSRESGPSSPSRLKRCSTPTRNNPPEFDPTKLTLENATRAGKGVSRIVAAGMKSPLDFTLGLARGFHNAPKLYGDDTVRPQAKVTDFQSGIKAAGKVTFFDFNF
jgi:hypothetical protein